MRDQNKIETKIKERLSEIKIVPPRNPQAASRVRAQFLSQAVSASESQRHNGWISKFRKEHFAMNTIISTLLIAGLLFGGSATVNAAQDELPNEPLYELKIWSEDLGLRFQNDDQEKVDRLMELAQIRVQEMARLTEIGEPVPEQVRLRLDHHIQQALQICTNMDDPALERTLLQIRDRLHQQDRDLEQLQLYTQDGEQLLTQTRAMLQERIQLVEDGLANHEAFRNNVQNGYRYGQDDELTPPVQDRNGQPALTPNGPNTDSGGPNTDPGGPNTNPGGPNDGSGSNGNGAGGNESNSNGSDQNGK